MKFLETHFEDYIHSSQIINLHSKLDKTFQKFPNKEVYQSGFYSYGELSSTKISKCSLHNQTLTQAVFWEDDIDE